MITSPSEWSWLDPRHGDRDNLDAAIHIGEVPTDDLPILAVSLHRPISELAAAEIDRREDLGAEVDRRHPFGGEPLPRGWRWS